MGLVTTGRIFGVPGFLIQCVSFPSATKLTYLPNSRLIAKRTRNRRHESPIYPEAWLVSFRSHLCP